MRDPSPAMDPAPVVPWATMKAEGARVPHSRRLGAGVGLAVGLAFDLGAVLLAYGLHVASFDGEPIAIGSIVGSLFLGGVVALTGAIGGAVVGPAALGSHTRWEWAAVVLELGLLAVVVGAELIGIGALLVASFDGSVVWHLLVAIGVGAAIGLLGVAVYGVFVLPVTLVAAVIWCAALRWIRSTVGQAA